MNNIAKLKDNSNYKEEGIKKEKQLNYFSTFADNGRNEILLKAKLYNNINY